MPSSSCAVSAPGKVLLAGGYLVLDQKHTGLVFGLDARIHVHVQTLPTGEGVTLQEIVVKSPQFLNATWRYGYHTAGHGGGIIATQLDSGPIVTQPNPFVETALSYALTYVVSIAKHSNIDPASITILADNDYYSQPANSELDIKPVAESRFHIFNTPLSEAHKTGLGSSAALVTAFVAAVLVHYLPAELFSLSTDTGKYMLHNLAQAAHSAAQGKVGSGFDVASAVFGSCVYKRFSPSLVESLGNAGSQGFGQRLKDLVEDTSPSQKWDVEVVKSKVNIPEGLRLLMCDVDCGSKTPGMVKQVLHWRKSEAEVAGRLWSELQSKNDSLAAELVRSASTEEPESFEPLRQCILSIRTLIREMSKLSGVPIEPAAQTELLDACSNLPGVIGGVTPGAGGYDAVVLLVEDKSEVIQELNTMLAEWRFNAPGSEHGKAGKVRLLGVREETEGIKGEKAADYRGWIEASGGF